MVAEVDPASVMALQKAIKAVESNTRRDMASSVVWAAITVAKSGSRASKMGKKNRDWIPNPEAKANLVTPNAGAKFLIVVLKQGKKPEHIPTNVKKDPRREIKTRGLAKRTWLLMQKRMGAGGKGSTRGARKRIYVHKALNDKDPAITLINKLTYLEKAYPGITNTAIENGTKALLGKIKLRLKRSVKL